MPKTITTTVYTFDELNDEAKEKARDWYRQASTAGVYDQSCEMVKEDAARIGLQINFLNAYESNGSQFLKPAACVAMAIVKDHGTECETYKTAAAFQLKIKELHAERTDGDEYNEAVEREEQDFLAMLLEDYRVMRDKEDEYQLSDEVVDETILANGYTFTETGKREG